jgi:hypothetical protein
MQKKIKLNQMDKLVATPPNFELIYGEGDDTFVIQVKPVIKLVEGLSFVNEVVSTCVVSDETVLYAQKEFLIRIYMISYYTNLTIPKDADQQYNLAYNSGLYEKIISHPSFKSVAYNDLLNAIEYGIDFEVQKARNEMRIRIQNYIDTINKKSDEFVETLAGVTDVFKSVSPDEIKEMLSIAPTLSGLNNEEMIDKILNKNKSNVIELNPNAKI